MARGAGDDATAVVAHGREAGAGVGERLREVWPLIRDCRPQSTWRAGVSAPVDAADLDSALTQARYALAAARSSAPGGAPVVVQGELDGVALLLAGVPSDVRAVYRETVLGPLLEAGPKSGPMLLDTLRAFLSHDCSWARTAEALHIHVNTVHYRVQRIELLTGRDLSRLDNRLDLRTALLC